MRLSRPRRPSGRPTHLVVLRWSDCERWTGTLLPVVDPADEYLAREAKARINIDRQLVAAGWVFQHADKANLSVGRGSTIM